MTGNGVKFLPVDFDIPAPATHSGGSEVGFAFNLNGDVWGVIRNEDGDVSGWGSRIFKGDAGNLGEWKYT